MLVSVSREHGADFLENCPRSRFGIWGSGDRPANHQIVRARADRFRGSGNTRLIISFFRSCRAGCASTKCRPDARNDDQEIFPASAANRAYLMRRSHDAVKACLLR